ncbi:MAG: N-acetylglucosamine-6-phosphate deacetylase [Streptomycetaceae bacterium]|jgi:N-acetylglucosamine-6-phosphate deacetylase|nr:MAG: N-acetylglucosamine-6-phosphate deacetylase [Streptomycetaceae bacterium]
MISTFIESGAVPTEKALINQHWVNGGIVVKDRSLTSYGETAGRSGLAIPGFVDLQVNGHGGMDLLSAKTVSDIKQVSKSLYSQGVVGYLPTLITGPKSETLRVMALIENAKREAESDEAKILGIHLEGPFISTAKPGVHPLEHFQIPNLDLIGEYLRAGTVSIVTIAPELPGAIGVIKHLTAMGIVVSLGHSNATAEEAHAGFDAGAKTVTHLWNAMPPMTLRSPGLVGVALERDDVTIQIIVDGVHVAPEVVKATIAAAPDRFIVTNDAVAPAGLGEGKFPFGTFEVEVKAGRAVRSDGVLAGGVESLYGSLNLLLDLGVNLESAIASMSSRPAALIGQGHIGNLDLGAPVQVIPA